MGPCTKEVEKAASPQTTQLGLKTKTGSNMMDTANAKAAAIGEAANTKSGSESGGAVSGTELRVLSSLKLLEVFFLV